MNKEDKILVAGANGVAGSAIVRKLNREGFARILTPSHKELELSDYDDVKRYFDIERPEYVFYTAAQMGSITYRVSHPVELLLENLLMQTNVIRNSHDYGVKRLLFMSSDFIYPEKPEGSFRESDFLTGMPCKRDFPYSLAKITGVKLCDYYREEYGDDFFTVVPCAFFGMNSSFELGRANVVASMMHRMHDAKIKKDDSFVLWGSGRPVKEFLYSDDLADACVLLMNLNVCDTLYNVGDGSGGITISELARTMKEVIGYSGDIRYDLTKPDGILRRVPDSTKIRDLGWRPHYSIKGGIEQLYTYFLSKETE